MGFSLLTCTCLSVEQRLVVTRYQTGVESDHSVGELELVISARKKVHTIIPIFSLRKTFCGRFSTSFTQTFSSLQSIRQ